MADETNDTNPAADELSPYDTLTAGTYVDGELHQTDAQKAAAGPQPEAKTVTMDVLRDGSFNGTYYHTGDTADVPEAHVEALTLSGFAARADRAEQAQKARDAKTKATEKAAAKRTGTKPLSTADVPGAEPPKE